MIINEQYIYDWMTKKKGLKETVAKANLSRIKRIDEVYNLFKEYLNDYCEYLLSLFEYSTSDERNGLVPAHDIVIDGNYYTGTQSLKYALKLYIEAEDDDDFFEEWIKEGAKSEDDGISYDEFNELFTSLREMGPINSDDIRKIIDEYKNENVQNEMTETPADSSKETEETEETEENDIPSVCSTSAVVFKGSIEAFRRYVGPFCKNYVNSIAKSERSKHKGICEYCGSKAVLDSAHRDGEERPIIIEKILEAHYKVSENYYEVDILEFEKLFKNAHLPVEEHIFFLCKKCHNAYDKEKTITTADILAKRKP